MKIISLPLYAFLRGQQLGSDLQLLLKQILRSTQSANSFTVILQSTLEEVSTMDFMLETLPQFRIQMVSGMI